MDELIISPAARKVILQDALDSYPNECCGFMYGYEDNTRIVSLAVAVENTHEDSHARRFAITPQDYIKAEEFADANNLLLLGIYHSHPDHPAVPSDYDLRRAMPWFSYVIVSVRSRKIAGILSWKLNNNHQFEEEKVTLKEEEFNVEQLLSSLNDN